MLFMSIPLPPSPRNSPPSEDIKKIELLYEKYHKLMYHVAYKVLQHNEDAEDAVIDAWLKIIGHLDKINEIDCKETQSLFVIIVERAAIDLYRKNRTRRNFETLIDDYDSSPYFITKDIELENMELYHALRRISKKYSEVIILHYVNGFTGKEIANLLDIKETTVMVRLSRGRELLRKEMGKND